MIIFRKYNFRAIFSCLAIVASPFLVCCNPCFSSEVLNIRDYGAVGDGKTDDSPAFEKALRADYAGKIFFPPGIYLIGSDIDYELDRCVDIKGAGRESVLLFGGESAIKISSTHRGDYRFKKSAGRGSREIALKQNCEISNSWIDSGDIVFLYSPRVAETSWNTPTFHTTLASSFTQKEFRLFIEDPLNFDFPLDGKVKPWESPAGEPRASVYRSPGSLRVSSLTFRVKDASRSNARPLMIISFLQDPVFSDIKVLGNTEFRHRGIQLRGCVGGYFKNIRFNRMHYGFLINYSRNLRFEDIESHNSRHPVTIASWSDGIYVDTLYGSNNQGIVESHPAFNVHYNNVISEDEAAASNLRSVGGSVRNTTLAYWGEISSGPYFHSLSLADREIYHEYDFLMENVTLQASRPINVSHGGEVVFRNVRCIDLDGKDVGINVGEGVKMAVFENSLAGRVDAEEKVVLENGE